MALFSSKISRSFALLCVLSIGLAGCSDEKPSADEPSVSPQATVSPQSTETTQLPLGPVDIDAAMQTELNDVLTTARWSFPSKSVTVSQMTADERVSFAMGEGFLHGRLVYEGTDWNELEWILPFDEANKWLERYLGRPVTREEAAKVSSARYVDDTFRIPFFDGLLIDECAVADSLERQEDGTYKAQFTVWQYPAAAMQPDEGLTAAQAQASPDYTRTGSGSAVLESYVYDGKETYRIVSYNFVEGKSEGQESSSSQNEPFWGVWFSAYKSDAEAQQAAAATGMPEVQVVVTSEWENLNPETWYALTYGRYSTEAEANQARQQILSQHPDAYVKYSGAHR
ncbi:MAG: hypothetical protein IKS49_06315 [Actinomycetaceae bacterium]|nr:hypothetical protein [Actinomycetaceae bacterium]